MNVVNFLVDVVVVDVVRCLYIILIWYHCETSVCMCLCGLVSRGDVLLVETLLQVGTCESFVFVRIESNRPSDSFSNRIFESNRPYTTQAVTQLNGRQAYCTACYRPIIC